MNKILICLIVIVVLIFIGVLFILFVRNKCKTKKLFGGMGSITKYGSTVFLNKESKIKPIVIKDNIVINTNSLSADDVNLINIIAQNPLSFLLNDDANNIFHTYVKELNWYKHFYLSDNNYKNPLNLYEEISNNLRINDFDLFDKYNKIIIDMQNEYREAILFINTIVAQGNISPFFYSNENNKIPKYYNSYNNGSLTIIRTDENNILQETISISDISEINMKAFRSWFSDNTRKHEKMINIFPSKIYDGHNEDSTIDNGNEILTRRKDNLKSIVMLSQSEPRPIFKYETKNRNSSYGIADIYPAKMNAEIALLICSYCNEHEYDDAMKYKIIALHILMVYLINIKGHFAHYGPYNSAISDRFYAM